MSTFEPAPRPPTTSGRPAPAEPASPWSPGTPGGAGAGAWPAQPGAGGGPWPHPTGHPQGPWPPQPPDHPRGTLVLTLGLLSMLGLVFLGPFAWVLGQRALREADAAPHPTGNRSQLQWGRTFGAMGTFLLGVYVATLTGLFLFA